MHMPELRQQGDAGSYQGQQGALPDREENPAFWQMRDLLEKRAITEKQAEILRQEAAVLEQENQILRDRISILGTVESVKQIARDILGLVDPDTVIFETE